MVELKTSWCRGKKLNISIAHTPTGGGGGVKVFDLLKWVKIFCDLRRSGGGVKKF